MFFCCDVTKVFNFNMYRAQWLLQSSRNNDSARLLAASLMLCAQKYNSTQSSFCYHTCFGEDWTRDFLHVSIFQPECRCRFIATQLFFVGQIYTNVLALSHCARLGNRQKSVQSKQSRTTSLSQLLKLLISSQWPQRFTHQLQSHPDFKLIKSFLALCQLH